jgi:hypothetical protein
VTSRHKLSHSTASASPNRLLNASSQTMGFPSCGLASDTETKGSVQQLNRQGNLAIKGSRPVHQSSKKQVRLPLCTSCLAPGLKYHLIFCMEFQNWEPRIGTLTSKRSRPPRYFARMISAHRPSACWYSFQIRLSISAMFISLVLRIPNPPKKKVGGSTSRIWLTPTYLPRPEIIPTMCQPYDLSSLAGSSSPLPLAPCH